MTLARIAIDRLNRRVAALAACVLLFGSAAMPAGAQTSEFMLANGMKVYSSIDRTTPNVTVQVWYE